MNFTCIHCGKEIDNNALGTKHRNHCPFCLWSKHLDITPGDRQSGCGGTMKPIGLTAKTEDNGLGELMVVHKCQKCGVQSKNRLAGDDQAQTIIEVFEESLHSEEDSEFKLLAEADRREIMTQVYGRAYADAHLPR